MSDINTAQVLVNYIAPISAALGIGYGMYRFAKYSLSCHDKDIYSNGFPNKISMDIGTKKEHSINDLEIKVLPLILH